MVMLYILTPFNMGSQYDTLIASYLVLGNDVHTYVEDIVVILFTVKNQILVHLQRNALKFR
jgi:hypothetical protein